MFKLLKYKILNWWHKECAKIEELWNFKYPKTNSKLNNEDLTYENEVKSPDNRMNFPLENTCPTCHKDFGCECE